MRQINDMALLSGLAKRKEMIKSLVQFINHLKRFKLRLYVTGDVLEFVNCGTVSVWISFHSVHFDEPIDTVL